MILSKSGIRNSRPAKKYLLEIARKEHRNFFLEKKIRKFGKKWGFLELEKNSLIDFWLLGKTLILSG